MGKKQKDILYIVGALVLYIIHLYITTFLMDLAYTRCSPLVYMIVKWLLKWSRLLIPVWFMKMEHITWAEIGITTNKLPSQAITGILIGSCETFVIVGSTLLFSSKEQLGKPMYEEGWLYSIYLFYAIFCVGLGEEIFYRGYLYKKLQDIKNSKWFAIIISSIIFGMGHIVGYDNVLQAAPQVLFTAMSGIFYCILREKVRGCTLIALIVAHGIYDFWVGFLPYILA